MKSLNRTRKAGLKELLFRSASMEAAEIIAFRFTSACESTCALLPDYHSAGVAELYGIHQFMLLCWGCNVFSCTGAP